MLNVGIAGIGFMGWIHYLAYLKSEGIRLGAICTRNPRRRAGDWTGIQGNFGPPGEQIDMTGIQAYAELDEMLADPNVDLIDNCLPPHLHAGVSIRALEAGKHVFCEKPMALTAEDCERMVAAARQAGKQILVGHVLPFFPEFAFARQAVERGDYGKLLGGSFKRVISTPDWLPDFFDPDRVGGPLIDLHVHDAHLIRLLFGMPTSLVSRGRLRGEVVDYCETLFGFDDPDLVVRAVSGVIDQPGRPFTHGYEMHFERATIQFEFAAFQDGVEVMPLKVVVSGAAEPEQQVQRPDLGEGDPVRGFEAEIAEVVQALQQDQPSKILSGELARDAILLCHKQTESVRSGGPVTI